MASFKIQDVYNILGVGTVIAGKVISETIRVGQRARLENKDVLIVSLEMNHASILCASQGDLVGMKVQVTDFREREKQSGFLSRLFKRSDSGRELLCKHQGDIIEFI